MSTNPNKQGSALDSSRPLLGIFPAVFALFLAVCAVIAAAWNVHNTFDSIRSISVAGSQTREVRLLLEHMMSFLKDVESGSRGFVITGKPEFLESYNSALEKIPVIQAELRKHLLDEQDDNVDWNKVETLFAQRIDLAKQAVSNRTLGKDANNYPALFDAGNQAMQKTRSIFTQMEAFQDRRQAELTASIEQMQHRSEMLSKAMAITALILVVIAITIVVHEQRKRRSAEMLLRSTNLSLEQRVTERTMALKEALDRLAEFAGEQNRAVELERKRLSREVHDQIGQVFSAIKLISGSVPYESYPPGLAEALAMALEMGINGTRSITAALRPPLLDDLGLGAALTHFAVDLARVGQIEVTVDVSGDEDLSEEGRLGLFRIAQEAVTNALRHSQGNNMKITGAISNGNYLFRMSDNGIGFNPDELRPGAVGLKSMQERAMLIGGVCGIDTSATGVTIEVRLPWDKNILG